MSSLPRWALMASSTNVEYKGIVEISFGPLVQINVVVAGVFGVADAKDAFDEEEDVAFESVGVWRHRGVVEDGQAEAVLGVHGDVMWLDGDQKIALRITREFRGLP